MLRSDTELMRRDAWICMFMGHPWGLMTGHVRFTSTDIAAFGSWIIVGCIDAVSQAMGGVLRICPVGAWDT